MMAITVALGALLCAPLPACAFTVRDKKFHDCTDKWSAMMDSYGSSATLKDTQMFKDELAACRSEWRNSTELQICHLKPNPEEHTFPELICAEEIEAQPTPPIDDPVDEQNKIWEELKAQRVDHDNTDIYNGPVAIRPMVTAPNLVGKASPMSAINAPQKPSGSPQAAITGAQRRNIGCGWWPIGSDADRDCATNHRLHWEQTGNDPNAQDHQGNPRYHQNAEAHRENEERRN
jgi:hypothetical protein